MELEGASELKEATEAKRLAKKAIVMEKLEKVFLERTEESREHASLEAESKGTEGNGYQ